MKKSFVKSATLMMAATLVAKIIGACYRIPLTNLLGAEGMGLYQLVYPVYALILTASSGALPLAISVLVSEKNVGGNLKSGNSVVKSAFSILGLLGIFMSIILILTSGLIGSLQGAKGASFGYIMIAPSIAFVSGIAVLKGYFQGNHLMYPTALSQLSESLVKLIAGLGFVALLKDQPIEYQVAGALFGVSVSEGVTFLILFIMYRRKNPPLKLFVSFKEAREEYKDILKISLPITIGGMIFPLTQFIDSFMVVNILKGSAGSALATANYGLFSGPVSTLINLPVSLSLALGIAVVPHLSQNRTEHNLYAIRLKTSTAIKLAVFVGVPFTTIFIVMPERVLGFLYGSLSESQIALSAELLKITAPTVLLLSITQICTSVLQGLKDTKSPIRNLLIGGVSKTVASIILLYTLGIKGVAYAQLIAFSVTAILNLISVGQLMGKNRDVIKNSGVILLFGGIIGVSLTIAVSYKLNMIFIVLITLLSGIIYLVAVMASKVFSTEELMSIPFGQHIVRLKKSPK